ncbi:MAG: M23 family metallopeptidase [Gemmatimonadetes bacterium]|nr:M23 family metallopeptidase [Gemmatimonadota bacterium]
MLELLASWISTRLGAVAGVCGFVGVGALALVPVWGFTWDAGYLPPLVAAPAEELRVELLTNGTTFGELLNGVRLDGNDQQNLLLAFQEHADPRRLRVGTEVTLRFFRGDGRIRGVDVAVSKDELVRLERDVAGWASIVVPTPVQVDTLAAVGSIETSLWNAVRESAGLASVPWADQAEVIGLVAQVFQSQIDFSRQIRPGDAYRLVFEREVRPDRTMRSGRILAAEVVNAGKTFSAVWFDLHDDGIGGYYDLQGESLKRAFLLAPLDFRRVSSRFSLGRLHPILNVIRAHVGVDYAAAIGTPVMATGDGMVTQRGVGSGYGNLIEIRHGSGEFVTRYGHLSRFASGLRVGDWVSQGQTIGYVGMTGLATGPHLHYEMRRNGAPTDPLSLDMPEGDPIPPSARDRWTVEFGERYAMLTNLSPTSGQRMADTGAPPGRSQAARNE